MSQQQWTAVDEYIAEEFFKPDPVLETNLKESAAAGLPSINVTAPQGRLLGMLSQLQDARRILEIGTLGGYSSTWLARSLPADGKLITLEVDPKHAEVARANLERAGLIGKVEILLGPALETLPKLEAEGRGPFDLIFIDADKPGNADYFQWALRLSHRGSLIVIDNVVRDGQVIDTSSKDPAVLGVRRLNEAMAAEPRIIVTEIQTVGSKGYDGLALALVTA